MFKLKDIWNKVIDIPDEKPIMDLAKKISTAKSTKDLDSLIPEIESLADGSPIVLSFLLNFVGFKENSLLIEGLNKRMTELEGGKK